MDFIDISLRVAEILIIVGAAAAIILPLINSLGNPGSLIKTGIGVVILAGVFLVAYSISDAEVLPKYAADPFNLTPGMSKFVGGALYATYALFITALAGIAFTELNKAIR